MEREALFKTMEDITEIRKQTKEFILTNQFDKGYLVAIEYLLILVNLNIQEQDLIKNIKEKVKTRTNLMGYDTSQDSQISAEINVYNSFITNYIIIGGN